MYFNIQGIVILNSVPLNKSVSTMPGCTAKTRTLVSDNILL